MEQSIRGDRLLHVIVDIELKARLQLVAPPACLLPDRGEDEDRYVAILGPPRVEELLA